MKKSVKVLLATTAATVFALSSAVTGLAATGWVQNGSNWQYYSADGTMASNRWVISGDYWYWIGDNGVMATNKWINNQDKWYFVDENGASAKGWKAINGKWYFFYDDFTMAVNTTVDSSRVGKDGAMIE